MIENMNMRRFVRQCLFSAFVFFFLTWKWGVEAMSFMWAEKNKGRDMPTNTLLSFLYKHTHTHAHTHTHITVNDYYNSYILLSIIIIILSVCICKPGIRLCVVCLCLCLFFILQDICCSYPQKHPGMRALCLGVIYTFFSFFPLLKLWSPYPRKRPGIRGTMSWK